MIKKNTHHNLDIYSIPKGKEPLFINEPELIDGSLSYFGYDKNLDDSPDNVWVYVPLDISRDSILRRLNYIIARLGAASEYNESDYASDVSRLINQIEIYDQIWYVRNIPKSGSHSLEAKDLVIEFISRLEEIPDECAELFPFQIIDELRKEYLEEE